MTGAESGASLAPFRVCVFVEAYVGIVSASGEEGGNVRVLTVDAGPFLRVQARRWHEQSVRCMTPISQRSVARSAGLCGEEQPERRMAWTADMTVHL